MSVEEIWQYGDPKGKHFSGPKGGGLVYRQIVLYDNGKFVSSAYFASLSRAWQHEVKGTWERGRDGAVLLIFSRKTGNTLRPALMENEVRKAYPE